MVRKFKAIYTGQAALPQEPVDLPAGTAVDIVWDGAGDRPATPTNGEQRRQLVERLIARMRGNPIPAGARTPTRDELHERR